MTAACGGITTVRNARISSSEAERDHDEDLERQLARRSSTRGRRSPRCCRRRRRVMSVPFSAFGITLVAEVVDEVGGRVLGRTVLRDRVEVGGRARLVDLDRRDRRDAGRRRHVLLERLQARVGRARVGARGARRRDSTARRLDALEVPATQAAPASRVARRRSAGR